MSKKFSELPPKESLDSADYIPIVDSADSNPETQNKIVTFQTVRGYFTEDLDAFLEQAQAAESARVTAENARRSSETIRNNAETARVNNETTRQANEATRQANEAAREDAETGYIQQAKSWAVGTNGVARQGDATDNAKYYAEQAGASASNASTSAINASASETSASASAQSAQASATQAAISAESVDAPALTKKILASFPQESLSGSLITLTDGADGIPAKKLTLSLSPHQSGSGDPSPDNVRPISGYERVKVTRAGKNICTNIVETHTRAGVTLTRMSDGTLVFNGTATAEAVFYVSVKNGGSGAESLFGITPGEYTISGCPEGGHAQTYYVRLYLFQDTNYLGISYSETGGGRTFTVEAPANRYRVAIRIQSGQVCDNLTFKPQLEVGNTATAYEPYTGEEYDITIPTATGTVYGGSLEINEDGTGTLTVDNGYIKPTSVRRISTYTPAGLKYWQVIENADGINTTPSNKDLFLSNTFRSLTGVAEGNFYVTNNGNVLIVVPYAAQQSIDNVNDAGAWLASVGAEFVYPLAQPTTYTLTADQVTTLLGDNTLWMDADGSIDLQYRADTQKYIDSRLALLNSNLAFIEDGMTASRAYTVGQFVLIGGQLYRVTSAISSGATFTIGTNVVSTTVGTELTALNN